MTKVRIEGLREIQEALRELPRATGKNVLKRVLKQAADPIADAIRSRAPEDRGHLKGGIVVTTPRLTGGAAGKRAFAEAMREGATRTEAGAAARAANASSGGGTSAEIEISTGRHPQAVMQEFGTAHHPPQPFMRPVWDAMKMQAAENIKGQLWAEIRKAAERHARKAARLAAKG